MGAEMTVVSATASAARFRFVCARMLLTTPCRYDEHDAVGNDDGLLRRDRDRRGRRHGAGHRERDLAAEHRLHRDLVEVDLPELRRRGRGGDGDDSVETRAL